MVLVVEMASVSRNVITGRKSEQEGGKEGNSKRVKKKGEATEQPWNSDSISCPQTGEPTVPATTKIKTLTAYTPIKLNPVLKS
jgi:hypothetical protein